MFKSLFIATILVAVVVQADARRALYKSEWRRSGYNDFDAKNVLVKGLVEVERLVTKVINDDLKIPFLNEVLTIVHKTIRKVRAFYESLPKFIKDVLDRGVDFGTNIVLRFVGRILGFVRSFINKFRGFFFF